MPTKPTSKAKPSKAITTPAKPVQTTLVPGDWGKKAAAASATKRAKGKGKTSGNNGNIIAFFQKAEEQNNKIFYEERGPKKPHEPVVIEDEAPGWEEVYPAEITKDDNEGRFNEIQGSMKRRRISEDFSAAACTLSPPENRGAIHDQQPTHPNGRAVRPMKRIGPFIDDSDSEDEEVEPSRQAARPPSSKKMNDVPVSKPVDNAHSLEPVYVQMDLENSRLDTKSTHQKPPQLIREVTSQVEDVDSDEFGALDDGFSEGEEYEERKWMDEQRKFEMEEAGFAGDSDDFDPPSMFREDNFADTEAKSTGENSCPICNKTLTALSEQEVSVHVNACLDGNLVEPYKAASPQKEANSLMGGNSKVFKKPPRLAKPGQENPFQLGDISTESKSAFSKLMASHAEDNAWASAAAAESASRGKPSYTRTCPFYKILPGFYICVDAFRYGAVKGQQAYFLSHFHSDHYVGLTSTWSHGPIYCSRVTGNLVRQQLRVDPKWVVDLKFENKTEIPGTEGVHVTMIPANHCPGSSLFLFEKELVKETSSKLQRVLHCGDFRACQAHIEHPLLRPDVVDAVSGKNRQQKLDVCYLDTTYLNPKYSFPPQEQVIQACADMCVSLNKPRADKTDGFEQMKKERAGEGMVKFVRKSTDTTPDDTNIGMHATKERGRLLVVVGTYSIGKERVCIGIAKALNSKIYAPANKQRICKALEDEELNGLLTKNPREAQVHMTPLFEIRADTLEEYLRDYRDQFSRVVGFRPSGWNYRPPNSRFTESPSVQTVLYSPNWKSSFSMRDLVPQRGSTKQASCFGVPYSEHSSFRELTMFCCALQIEKIIPTVNVGSAKSREKMKSWCERWAVERKKSGVFKLQEDGSGWC
ncbi:DRMBL-domain-containing protein [Delitschia confertaspora ATCC 74209]|uniref:DRMBL-domain-containing protein n=1 Tax=Delitschia confertaspora ATCC 74209 TaxID=1513339 RepID=A0A9P4JSG2_9PLEO|nr:DRMBL-domain-containing protein [Delitschia confertaspora ATCC 74209]